MDDEAVRVRVKVKAQVKTKVVVFWDPPPKTCQCPLCLGWRTKCVYSSAGLRIHRCRDCGAKFRSVSGKR
jgi:hypothetical protein